MVIAVLDKRAGAPIGSHDIFAATVGGARVTEPAADLALVCALASSVLDLALPVDAIAIGEVGLAGEVRRATGIGRRLNEAARLGFRHAVVPTGSRDDAPAPDGLDVIEVGTVSEAIETMRRLAIRRTAPAMTRDTA
jgi:DNA repair protein RadA/Sms